MSLTCFRNIVIRDRVRSPETSELQALEERLCVAMPAEVRAFIEAANGGILPYKLQVTYGEGWAHPTPMTFGQLYSTDRKLPSRAFNFLRRMSLFAEQGLPSSWLPIIFFEDGEEIFLDMSQKPAPAVIALFPGSAKLAANANGISHDSRVVRLADNLSSFLEQLELDFANLLFRLEFFLEKREYGQLGREIVFLDKAMPDWRALDQFSDYKHFDGPELREANRAVGSS